MISQLRQILRRHWLSAVCGAFTGIAAAIVWITWFAKFAPFTNEASSAWSVPDALLLDQRTPQSFYKPRVDDLLGGLRVHGRFGGSAWQSLREATEAWLLADPVACLNHLIKNGAIGLIDDALLNDALQHATGGNFAVALARVDEIEDGRVRNRWIKNAFLQHAKDDPESAFVALRSVPKQLIGALSFMLIEEWTSKDAGKAFQTFFENRDALSDSVAWVWAMHDPDAAYAFVSGPMSPMRLQDGRMITSDWLKGRVMASMVFHHPEKAIRLAQTFPDGPQRSSYILNAVRKIAGTDPQRALQLVDDLPGDLLRLQMRGEIAQVAARADPAFAAEIRQTLPGERARSHAETAGLWSGGYEDCASAAKKAVAITDPIARSDAMHATAGVWLQKKPLDAIQFAIAQASQAGDVVWLRVLTDTMVENAERSPSQPVLAPDSIKKLSAESRAQLRGELAKRPASPARDQFLRALQ